jgi:hypothetical protein
MILKAFGAQRLSLSLKRRIDQKAAEWPLFCACAF